MLFNPGLPLTGGTLAAGAAIAWSGASQISSPADGNILLQNNAGTGFGRLQFGGTTSSFAALKRSNTTLQARLADDSDDTPITASQLILPDNGAVGWAPTTTGSVDFRLQRVATSTLALRDVSGATKGFALSAATDGIMAVKGNAGTGDAQMTAKTVLGVTLTVATLPAAASNTAAIAFVSDANATTRLSIVAGGGANKVVVFSDGTNWLII